MVHVGFTGTQKGMTSEQRESLMLIFQQASQNGFIFHHGDCVGADEEAHHLVPASIGIEIHPPLISTKRAYCKGAVKIHPEKEYLTRNRDIVDSCDILFAAPETFKDVLRSGTWSTFRYAKSLKKPICLFYPDGDMGPIPEKALEMLFK